MILGRVAVAPSKFLHVLGHMAPSAVDWRTSLSSFWTFGDLFALLQPAIRVWLQYGRLCDRLLTLQSYSCRLILFQAWYGLLQRLVWQHFDCFPCTIVICRSKKYCNTFGPAHMNHFAEHPNCPGIFMTWRLQRSTSCSVQLGVIVLQHFGRF